MSISGHSRHLINDSCGQCVLPKCTLLINTGDGIWFQICLTPKLIHVLTTLPHWHPVPSGTEVSGNRHFWARWPHGIHFSPFSSPSSNSMFSKEPWDYSLWFPGPAVMKRRSLLSPKLGKLKVIEEKVPRAGPGLELVPTNFCGIWIYPCRFWLWTQRLLRRQSLRSFTL